MLWLKSLPQNINLVVFLPNPKLQPKGLCLQKGNKYCNGTQTGSTIDFSIKELIPLLFVPYLATTLLALYTSTLAPISCSGFFKAFDRSSWPYSKTWHVVMDASCCCHPRINQEPFRKIPLLILSMAGWI